MGSIHGLMVKFGAIQGPLCPLCSWSKLHTPSSLSPSPFRFAFLSLLFPDFPGLSQLVQLGSLGSEYALGNSYRENVDIIFVLNYTKLVLS